MFHSKSFRVACACALAATLYSAPYAEASPLFEQTGDLLGSGGINARFTGNGAGSAYFNPGRLAKAENGVSVGFALAHQGIGITLGPRDQPFGGQTTSFDVPSLGDSFSYKGGRSWNPTIFSTEDLYRGISDIENPLQPRPRQGQGSGTQSYTYATLGLVNRIIDKYLVAGFYAMLPLGDFTGTHAFFPDEREQFFSNSLHPELYGDRMIAPSIAVAFASNPIPELTLGMAFTIALLNTADAGVFTQDAGDLANGALLMAKVGVIAKIAPHFSVNYEPIPDLTLTFVAHSPSRFDIGLNFSNTLTTGDEQVAERVMTHDYNPWFFALGGEYKFDVNRFQLRVLGGINIGLWSQYLNRHNERPGYEYEAEAAMYPGTTLPPGDYKWRNTVSPSLGLRFGEDEKWTLGGDVQYMPTPIPEQTGRTNYVDNNKLITGINFDYRFDAGPLQMGVGANVQGHFLFSRRNTKIVQDTSRAIYNPSSSKHGENYGPDLVQDEVPDSIIRGSETEVWDKAQGLQTNNAGFPWFESGGAMFVGSAYISLYY